MYGSTMIARTHPAANMLGPYIGPGEERKFAEVQRVFEKRHDVVAKKRNQNEETPQAVDDARNRGEQIDEKRDRLAHPARREFREKNRDADRERRRDEERDDRRDHRAENRRRRPNWPLHRVPVASVKKPTPK